MRSEILHFNLVVPPEAIVAGRTPFHARAAKPPACRLEL
jgi:hypothetical protein